MMDCQTSTPLAFHLSLTPNQNQIGHRRPIMHENMFNRLDVIREIDGLLTSLGCWRCHRLSTCQTGTLHMAKNPDDSALCYISYMHSDNAKHATNSNELIGWGQKMKAAEVCNSDCLRRTHTVFSFP